MKVMVSEGSRADAHALNDLYERWKIRREIPMHDISPDLSLFIPYEHQIMSMLKNRQSSQLTIIFLGERRKLIENKLKEIREFSLANNWNKSMYEYERKPYVELVKKIESYQTQAKKFLFRDSIAPKDFTPEELESFELAKYMIRSGGLKIARVDDEVQGPVIISMSIAPIRREKIEVNIKE